MNESSLLDGLDRFSERKDVKQTLLDITEATAGLNESLSYSSGDYDSLVVFSHDPTTNTALPISTTDAYNTNRMRHAFRDTNITNRRVLLKGTALGAALRSPADAGYAASKINHEAPQMVYSERLVHEGTVVGAIQHSFTPEYENGFIETLPEEGEMTKFSHEHRRDIAHAAAAVALLQSLGKEYGPLGLSLEYEDPIVPNSFVVRWDIEGSTRMAQGSQMRALDAYQNQAHMFIRRLAEDYKKRYHIDQYGIDTIYDDQGDGAYVILPLPASHNPYDTQVLADYQQYNAKPFIETVQSGLETIGSQFATDLHPKVHVSGSFGYVEPNGIGRLKSTTMFELSSQKKKK